MKVYNAGSRRSFLTRLITSGAGFASLANSRQREQRRDKTSALLYVGTYSSPHGPEGSKGNGEGIYLYGMSLETGTLTKRALFEDGSNPSWLALHPSGRFLYAANEIGDYQGANSGAVSAFSVDAQSGRLRKLNMVSSGGAGPAHLSVHPAGRFVFVANYAGGSFAVLPVGTDGYLGASINIQRESGKTGPVHAASAPAGSFAISGHDHAHAHMIQSDPGGRFVFGNDLGLDRIQIWKFDATAGTLTPNSPAYVSTPPGDGPRHFVFHPNGRWFYSLQEEGSTIILCDYDATNGRLTRRQQVSSLPPSVTGTNFTSEIRVSPDGRFLYVANRLHDSIAWFTIGSEGTLTFAGEVWTRGDYPRSFTIDPSGRFLCCCDQRSDVVTTFRVDRGTGSLTFNGESTPVGTPAIVVFLA